ncbi:MAG TPA: UDP-N-acetylmuramoyl-tripeptide--D-alanyl-D-alanine ligase [Gammaproteobacteria bacterium]|jgi:UDP-N-acetylmuramoyl-tripeptide--D-alanyl-D-alanine ligase|nr:UDP-N-acetylmuramoyl-tripeptide--D-alanyl-D-alanine ligase [Gammaproteobacteria bacterium]
MSVRRLSDLAAATGGTLQGEDREFTRVTQDSRKLGQGDLFIAIKGENFDGHDFLSQAEKSGAAGALVERRRSTALPQVLVPDVRKALGAYAAVWRRRFALPLVGVTGSSGKTTLKEMIASILRQRGATLATRGNMNNDIGMPLTLLELDASDRYAVIEMGTNHPGEIEYLARLALPSVSVVTNAGPAHLEFLKDVAGVAREKGAIFSCLAAGGVAVINADDAHARLWREMAGARKTVTFGFGEQADFHPLPGVLRQSESGSWQFHLVSPQGETDVNVSLPGRHNVANALAAAAAAMSAGASLDDVRAGLAAAPATAGRLIVIPGQNGSRLIDDSYNANPLSLSAAIEFAMSLSGRSWLVLGDMGELGDSAVRLHAESGARARSLGIERLYALGEHSRHAVEAFGSGARWFEDVNSLVRALLTDAGVGVTLLVKGSRSMRMERVVDALRSQPAARAANGDH